MGKRRSRHSAQRDVNTIASPLLRPLPKITPVETYLRLLQDRRTWHPEGDQRAVGATPRSARRLVVAAPQKTRGRPSKSVPSGIRFANPKAVTECVRREQRREVLHALHRTGKGSRSPKRRTWRSDIRCK